MRIGINGSGVMMMTGSLDAIAEHARAAAADGFTSYWLNQSSTGGGIDALTSIVVAARQAPDLEFGTAIVPTWGRHPAALATQALTTHLAAGGHLTLGIGLSHKESVEQGLGVPFDRPIRHMREYLTILQALLRDQRVAFEGEIWSCTAEISDQTIAPPSVIVAALGEQMLRLTGRLADGSILWMVGPKTVKEHIVPNLAAGAEKAGRAAPRVIASLPVCVTDEPDAVRQSIASLLARYGELPFYRAVLDREGCAGPADVSIVGSEDHVRERLAAFAAAGATDFAALEFPAGPDEIARTRALLQSLAAGAD